MERSLLQAFLSNFVNGVPWAHIDIAGTAWTQEGTHEKSYNPTGATGFGVRTLVKLLIEDEKQSANVMESSICLCSSSVHLCELLESKALGGIGGQHGAGRAF